MKIVFDSDNRGVSFSYYYGFDLPQEIEERNYQPRDIVLSDGVVVYSPYSETLVGAKEIAIAAVKDAYQVAANDWVPDGDPGTYSYNTTEIIGIQAVRTGTGNVTVTQKTIADDTTAEVSVNDAAFKVISASIEDFLADLITEYNGYLASIESASTVEDVETVLENL